MDTKDLEKRIFDYVRQNQLCSYEDICEHFKEKFVSFAIFKLCAEKLGYIEAEEGMNCRRYFTWL